MDYQYPEGTINTPGVPAPAPEALRTDFPQLKNLATIFSVPNAQINVMKEQTSETKFREKKRCFVCGAGIVFNP